MSGRFFLNVMASLAQMERELMVERTQAGLQAVREQGRVEGRKRLKSPVVPILEERKRSLSVIQS